MKDTRLPLRHEAVVRPKSLAASGNEIVSVKKLIYRSHAIKRMFERGIGEADVKAVINLGEVIQEYPDDAPYPSRLILGWCKERPIHVVAAYDNQEKTDIVITVYEPDHSLWEDGFKKRKPT